MYGLGARVLQSELLKDHSWNLIPSSLYIYIYIIIIDPHAASATKPSSDLSETTHL